jgi:hypothetical protein
MCQGRRSGAWCTVSHIMATPPQVSWLFFKAVRAGLAVTKRPYLDSLPTANFERNDVTIICETVH